MLDIPTLRAHAWRAWHIFAYAFVVYLGAIVTLVHQGSVTDLGGGTIFIVSLMAAIAVAGVGYQEVRNTRHDAQQHVTGIGEDDWSS